MAKIVVELGVDGIKDAIKELEEYKKSVNQRVDLLLGRLAEIGLETATVKFQAGAVGDNVPPERIYIQMTETGYKIVAKGGDVYIIEFGAGDAAGNHPDAANAPVDTSPGSLSRRNYGEYATYGSWHHKKVKYTEIPAAMPMYWASREMERNIKKIAKEIFK